MTKVQFMAVGSISASDDKTIRVWNVETGEIEKVIRGQIGPGHEGKIFHSFPSSCLGMRGGKLRLAVRFDRLNDRFAIIRTLSLPKGIPTGLP